MNEVTSPAEAPKKRGRPPGAKNKPKPESVAAVTTRYKMKAKPNWEDVNPDDFDEESSDRLRIDPALVPEGMSLQWVTNTVRGEPFSQHRARFEKNGWTPVHQEDFDRIFDGMFMPRGAPGEITHEGLVLMARPKELTRKAQLRDRHNAMEAVRIKEAALRGGDINTSLDSQHPSALSTNRINRTMERIEIPKD